jgi:hypothetical protein
VLLAIGEARVSVEAVWVLWPLTQGSLSAKGLQVEAHGLSAHSACEGEVWGERPTEGSTYIIRGELYFTRETVGRGLSEGKI